MYNLVFQPAFLILLVLATKIAHQKLVKKFYVPECGEKLRDSRRRILQKLSIKR